MGLGQYNNLVEYCGPHTASSVFLILVFHTVYTHSYCRESHNYVEVIILNLPNDIEHITLVSYEELYKSWK